MLNPGLKSVVNRVDKKLSWPAPDATRKHLFVLNYTSQTISVIDTGTDTVTSTITLPASNQYACLLYRYKDDTIYVWGLRCTVKINANPADPNFCNVTDFSGNINTNQLLTGIPSGYVITDCIYDFVNDIAVFVNNSAGVMYYYKFNGSTILGTSTESIQEQTACHFLPPNGHVTCAYNNYLFVDSRDRKVKNSYSPVMITTLVIGSLTYVKKYNYAYVASGPSVHYLNASTFKMVGSVASVGSGNGITQTATSLCYAPDYDLIFTTRRQQAAGVTGTASMVDASDNTALGTFTFTKETNALFFSGCVYSLYSKKFYLQSMGIVAGTNVNNVIKFNPQLWIANGRTTLADMNDGSITCGNMQKGLGSNLYSAMEHSMCMNHLIP